MAKIPILDTRHFAGTWTLRAFSIAAPSTQLYFYNQNDDNLGLELTTNAYGDIEADSAFVKSPAIIQAYNNAGQLIKQWKVDDALEGQTIGDGVLLDWNGNRITSMNSGQQGQIPTPPQPIIPADGILYSSDGVSQVFRANYASNSYLPGRSIIYKGSRDNTEFTELFRDNATKEGNALDLDANKIHCKKSVFVDQYISDYSLNEFPDYSWLGIVFNDQVIEQCTLKIYPNDIFKNGSEVRRHFDLKIRIDGPSTMLQIIVIVYYSSGDTRLLNTTFSCGSMRDRLFYLYGTRLNDSQYEINLNYTNLGFFRGSF